MADGYGHVLLENLALTATLSGGSWGGTLDNVLDPRITSLPARCADPSSLAASKLVVTWASPVDMSDILLCGHTGDLDAQYTVTAKEGGVILYAGEWTDFYGRIWSTSEMPWTQENWFTGKPRLVDIQGYDRHLHIRLPATVAVDELTIELDVTPQAASAEDFDLGYLMVALPLAPDWPYDWGRTLGMVRRTLEETTAGGRKIKTPRKNARRHTVSFPHLAKSEAMRLYDFTVRDGDHPAVFVANTGDDAHRHREVFPAHMTATGEPRETNELAEDGLSEWSITLNFEEMQG